MTRPKKATSYFLSNLPEFERALEEFFKVYQALFTVLEPGLTSAARQYLANGNDVYFYSKRILTQVIYDYQKALDPNIQGNMGLLPEVDGNDPEYVERYIERHGKKPPVKRFEEGEFNIALRKARRHIREVSLLTQTLIVAYKPFLIYVRSLQDTIYCIMLRKMFNQNVGKNSSMIQAIDQNARGFNILNPVGDFLSKKLPEYAEWFLTIRALRNDVKTGTIMSANLCDADPVIETPMIGQLDDGWIRTAKKRFGGADLTKAITFSTRLSALLIEDLGIRVVSTCFDKVG